ncbi:MAG: SUMF1/EgtB/PvdO family nonheme iron enzyme [Sedimentisphaerales bacterium]|nr:SUMF1/EgtB/PvdO family nonheme iron enzyme [Sedimentisphaerales bacterium]
MRRLYLLALIAIAAGRLNGSPASDFATIAGENSIGMKLARLGPNSFLMGQAEGGDWDEKPAHNVTISRGFFISTTEVTNAQYELFDPDHKKLRGKFGFSKDDDEAVVFVTWHDAVAFCNWFSEKEGRTYRLPTEAEWEYACRAGTTTPYSAGDRLPKEYHKNQKINWDPTPVSLKVAATPPNPWGLYDMHGNVEEWCADWYGPYGPSDQTNPAGPSTGDFRVLRGGAHGMRVEYLRSANRSGTLPQDKSWFIGFRVVQADYPDTQPSPPAQEPLNRRNIRQAVPKELAGGSDPKIPYFRGPIQYVKLPQRSEGPMYSRHNHDPALIDCPNGDMLAIWYSCCTEAGRELAILASRLRYGSDSWDPASIFWDAPDRNDHAPALYYDGRKTIYHINGLSAGATWGSMALVMRTSTDSGATWSHAAIIAPEHTYRHQPVQSVFQSYEGFIILPCDAVPGGTGGTAVHISRDNGKTWYDPGQARRAPEFKKGEKGEWIAGIHAAVVQLRDGSLMALGRGDNIQGQMPMSISDDMGRTWKYSPSPFPPISSGQRLILRRLNQGPILLVSFTDRRKGWTISQFDKRHVFGMFAALSFDEGKTWPVKRLITPGGPRKEVDGGGNTGRFNIDDTHAEPAGYLAATQTPDNLIHLITSKQHYAFNLAWLTEHAQSDYKADANVPGVVIDHSPAESRRYIGSPAIAILPNGSYVASHDFFGPGSKNNRSAVFRSEDKGRTWKKLTELTGQWWSSLFVHNGSLYIIGTTTEYGKAVIRRSDDNGQTWTDPKDARTGLLFAEGQYHCAPVPLVVHKGRIFRAMEDRNPPRDWGVNFRSFVISAPVEADLLNAESWTATNRLRFDQAWPGRAWLEGNIVVTPQGGLVNILRVQRQDEETAAVVRISQDGKTASFDPEKDFIHFYGGTNKFTIRFDPTTGLYWSIVNKQKDPPAYRNNLTLVTSSDLTNWIVRSVIMHHPDSTTHAFQYIDWLFDGEDIIAVSRTAFDDALGGAHRAHDANYMTFHRIENFRRFVGSKE